MNTFDLQETDLQETDFYRFSIESDYEVVIDGIDLFSEHFDRALEISKAQFKEAKQWQAYLNALALFAFEEWLDEREPSISINREKCTVFKPEYANLIPVVSNLKTGYFNVCLIVTNSIHEWVEVPRAVTELPEFTPDFYVLVDVKEELEVASVCGFLPRQDLENVLLSLEPQPNWSYQLPLDLFNNDSNDLLLCLVCLDSPNGSSPSSNTIDDSESVVMRTYGKLATALPKLKESELWEFLDWEEGAEILKNPYLVSGVYNLEVVERKSAYLLDVFELATQKAINVANWANNVIDEVGRSLSWNLIPACSAMRGVEVAEKQLEKLLKRLKDVQSIEPPPDASKGYKDLELAKDGLRLYALSWLSEEVKDEWFLLSILTSANGNKLPPGIKLRTSYEGDVLTEYGQPNDTNANLVYLCNYVQEVKNTEKLVVTVTTESGEKESRVFEWSRQ